MSPTPAREALSPQCRAALWGSGEEIAEPKALSDCSCSPVPGPDAQQCCPVRVIGNHEHIHLHVSPWKGVLSAWASGGSTKVGLFKVPILGRCWWACGPHVTLHAAIPPAVPPVDTHPHTEAQALEQSWWGIWGGEQPYFRLEQCSPKPG